MELVLSFFFARLLPAWRWADGSGMGAAGRARQRKRADGQTDKQTEGQTDRKLVSLLNRHKRNSSVKKGAAAAREKRR